ncbi:(Lyso)-N-acylphosphatidylethanolamine lipase isoform X2 [Chanos chanos]|uniref:(Lyso)-N-acylphosphatidylethanolamine lipase n=1 Tax=Chanos chanos TaxID=29144 RepID=A0A6J2VEV6_CHACN|nr:(Lyso)-N-acylphosphatidylethanolamine lipase-like isoform X2 [Chanos chanos]
MQDEIDLEQNNENSSWWPSWRPTSMSLLKNAEAKILACIKSDLWARFVTLPNQNRIRTLTVTNGTAHTINDQARTPLVMVHGFGGGVGLWIHNLDALSCSRTVHAFDLLGFGRSSRPLFSTDGTLAEEQFVSSIEQWREVLGLDRMILLGHSLGGYLATSYAIQYPERVSHLILVDPWGFPERPKPQPEASEDKGSATKRPTIPRWVKAVASVAGYFNPLAIIRAAGPWGPGLVNRFRPDFKRKFEDLFDDNTMTEYLYHCNAQTPSGEVGFRAMSESLGWAKRPMVQRVHKLPFSMPVTMLYGARSWVDSSTGTIVSQIRGQNTTRVMLIDHASHHVYADRPDEFNKVVQNICNTVD